MSIEKLNAQAPENITEETGGVDEEFPPFDPENARRLTDEAIKANKNGTFSINFEAMQKVLNKDKEEEKASPEYDFKNADRYQEQTFMLAAADSLMDSPDIARIDQVAVEASERAAKDGSGIFETLKALSREDDTDNDDYAATDLMGAFINTTAAYVVSKDKKPARGLAKGLITTMEMTLDSARTDVPNPAADKLRVDLALVQPILDEFIEGYNTNQESPNDFKNHLKNALEMEEIELRHAKMSNRPPYPDTERRIQALKDVLVRLEDLQSNYEGRMKNLRNTASAHRRIIK